MLQIFKCVLLDAQIKFKQLGKAQQVTMPLRTSRSATYAKFKRMKIIYLAGVLIEYMKIIPTKISCYVLLSLICHFLEL